MSIRVSYSDETPDPDDWGILNILQNKIDLSSMKIQFSLLILANLVSSVLNRYPFI